MKRRRVAGILALAAVVLLAVLAAGCGGGGDEEAGIRPRPPTRARRRPIPAPGARSGAGRGRQAGGTYRVDWETSFDFTDAFDVTGEYTAVGWSFYHAARPQARHLSRRPGAGGEQGRSRPGDRHGPGLGRRADLHLHAEGRDHVRPARQPRDHLEGHRYAFDRVANPDIGSFGYPNYYTSITGFQDVVDGKAEDDLRHRDARRQDDRLPPRQADRRLPLPARDAGGGPDPGRGHEVLHQGRRLRALRDLVRART